MSSATIGPYRILNEIGRGGMAVVYRAMGPGDTTDVAVKLMASGPTQDNIFRTRFRIEANVLRRLRHPAIVGYRPYSSVNIR